MEQNIYQCIPSDLREEVIETIINTSGCRIERIVSYGQSSPPEYYYDQDESEWIILLKGQACLKYADGEDVLLSAGDYLNIPSHKRHRVEWTRENEETIWLAIFYKERGDLHCKGAE